MKPEGILRFANYQVDPVARTVRREQEIVTLSRRAFDLLLYFVQNPGRLLTRDELLRKVWPDTFVDENSLAQSISVLRRALEEKPGDNRYIATLPGRGYQFVVPVEVVGPGTLVPNAATAIHGPSGVIVQQQTIRTRVIKEKEFETNSPEAINDQRALPPPVSSAIARRWYILFVVLTILLAAFAFRPMVRPPKVTRIRQMTRIGNLIHNTDLVTDGPRIYFRVWDGTDRAVRYMSAAGGEVFPLGKAFPDMDIDDIAPSGSELLIVNLADRVAVSNSNLSAPSVWRVPVPVGSPRPVGRLHSYEAKWSPDGRTLACSVGNDLDLVDPDGSNLRRVASLPGIPFYLVWSPDGTRIRFSVNDPHSNSTALWQADLSNNTVGKLLPDGPGTRDALSGGWTPDGRYFFYSAWSDGTRNIWAIREKDDWFHHSSHVPVQITNGPLTLYLPSPSKDGKKIFAVGEQARGQLLRFDAATRQFTPYAGGISADHVTFTRDGNWMAYVERLDGVLVRSRVDGGEREQLTFPPMRVFSPQWSPDGTQIAFEASPRPGSPNKIYLINSSGGVPVLAAPESRDRQTYPSWAADGNSILFSSSDGTDSNPVLRSVNLKTQLVSVLPGSERLYWAQLSTDGRYVVALEDTTQRLMLYDTTAHSTRALAEAADYPRWSDDGQFVYFSTIYFRSHGNASGVYRWKVSSNTTEIVAPFPDFLLSGIRGVSYGLTPDGSVLLLRDLSLRDLYALDLELP